MSVLHIAKRKTKYLIHNRKRPDLSFVNNSEWSEKPTWYLRNQLSWAVASATLQLQSLLLVITLQRNAESWTEICASSRIAFSSTSLLIWLLSSINPWSTFHCSFVSNSLSVWRKLSLSSKFSLLPITFALFADCLEKQGFCIHQFFQLSFVLKSSLCRGCWDNLPHSTCKHKRLLAFALKDLTLVRLISFVCSEIPWDWTK